MKQKGKVIFVFGLLLLSLGCRLSSPTPVAWVPTATAQLRAQTETASAQAQATLTAQITKNPTATPTSPPPTPTIAEDGPWLVFANQAGTGYYAHDADSGTLIPLVLPPALDPLDLASGISPDGKRLLVRAGKLETLTDLGFYLIGDPWQPAEKITALLSEQLIADILAEKGKQPKMALQAVQQPNPVSWTANSRQAVIPLALEGFSSDLYLYDAQAGSLKRLSERFQQEFAPFWAPGQNWLVFQEVNSYATPDAWEISLVGAWKMPKQDTLRYLFVPKVAGYWEQYVGWMNPEELVSYTATETGGIDLRLSNLNIGKSVVQFYGAFSAVALDPVHGSLAVSVSIADGKISGRKPGIYISKSGGLLFYLLMEGDYTHLEFAPQVNHFVATGRSGVLQFDSSGIIARLEDEERVSFSPDGKWTIGWGANGARLYYADGMRLQNLTEQSVSAVIWQKDGKGIYLLEQDGLYQLRFPLLQRKLVTADVYRGSEQAFAWLTGN
jgi:hypothetical protein